MPQREYFVAREILAFDLEFFIGDQHSTRRCGWLGK
jgi:hypothetical protein